MVRWDDGRITPCMQTDLSLIAAVKELKTAVLTEPEIVVAIRLIEAGRRAELSSSCSRDFHDEEIQKKLLDTLRRGLE